MKPRAASRSHGIAATAFIFLLATFVHAQNSQFLFDPSGNLAVQTANTIAPPQIIGRPQNRVVAPGETASFFVVATGAQPLTYQWRFNNANTAGGTNDALLLQNVGATDEGEYRVVLTNPSGSVTSAPAFLMIDGDHDGMGDSWELTHFLNLSQTAMGDADGDGGPNLQEFIDGSDPTDSNSIHFRLLVVRDGGSVMKPLDQISYTNGESVTLTAIASSGQEPFHAWLGGIVTRSNPVTLVMTNNMTVYARFTPIAFTWTNIASGDWDTAPNWTPNLVPGSNDTAIITSGVTVTLNTAAHCAGVTLGSAAGGTTLTGNGTLTVLGNFWWVNGSMSGNGRTILETGAALDVATTLVSLNSRTLENGGTVLLTGAGSLAVSGGAVVTNRASGLFHAQNATGIIGGGIANGRFDNAGTFRRSKTGTTIISSGLNFNNSGMVEIQDGTLVCNGGFSNTGTVGLSAGTTNRLAGGGSGNGTFNASAGALVEWTGGTFTLNTGARLSGAGTYSVLGSATVTADTDLSVSNLDLVNGTVNGTGILTVINVMNWNGGTMSGTGRTLIPAGATLNAAIPISAALNTRTLENGGTVLWTGAANFGITFGAVITNRAGALFHVQNAAALAFVIGAGRFDNAGTFRKSGNAGTTTIGSGGTFNNFGTVDIRSGILAANGTYTSSSNALLSCALGGTTAGTGFGQLQVAGTVTLNGALSVDLINGFSPALNDSFAVLTAGTRNGIFANFFHPSNVVTMQLSNTASSVIVRVNDVSAGIPQPMLFPPEITGTDFKLTWAAVSNTAYRVEFNPNLAPSNWNALPGDVIGVSNTASKLDPLTPSNRLYRVRVLP